MAKGGDDVVKSKINGINDNTNAEKKRVRNLRDKPVSNADSSIAKWLAIIPKLLTVIDIIIRLIEHITQL